MKIVKLQIYLIVIFSFIALWPFFKKGYFETHDGDWMIIRLSAFHQTLTAGQFPVRFVDRLNNNFGYPVFNFLYPLPFYFAEIPKLLGFNFQESIRIVTVTATLGSTLAMYWALSQKFRKDASLVGALVYLFIPYRFVDIYVRGSFGENVAFLFIPLILGSIFKVTKGNKLFLPILTFFVAGLILSHNVMAMIFVPTLFLVGMVVSKAEKLKIAGAFFVGFLISIFFWFPALNDLRFVKFSEIQISAIPDHLVKFKDLIVPRWGFGNIPKGNEGFSAQIGLVAIAIYIAACLFRLIDKKKNLFMDFLIIL